MNARSVLFLAAFFFFSIYYVIFRKRRQRFEELIDKFAGPKAYPFVGNIHLAVGTPSEILLRGKNIIKLGSPFRIWLLHKPFLMVFDPENYQTVAFKTLVKARGYEFLQELMGQGLITANGDKWKRNRRLLNPTFNPHLLNKYFLSVFNRQNMKLVNVLDKASLPQEQFNLWPHILQCFLNTICMTSMNYEDDHETGLSKYGDAILKTSNLVAKRIYKPWLHSDLVNYIYKTLNGYDKLFSFVETLPLKIIQKKKVEMEQVPEKAEEVDDDTAKNAKSFMELVLRYKDNEIFSNKELSDEIITLITAGSETSSITMCFTLLMLAMNPDAQDKVYEELHFVFGDDTTRAPDLEDLKQLVYLEQCIKETLRRFPPVPFVLREAVEDIELKDGKIIPAGTTIVLATLLMHHNTDVYEHPRRWDPNRFSKEEVAKRHVASFAAFSVGPRSCIAAKYAMLSIKTQLSTILRHFQVSTDLKLKDISLTFDMMLRNNKGYEVYLKRRTAQI